MDKLAHAGKKASLPKTRIGDCFVENHVTQLNTLSAASYG